MCFVRCFYETEDGLDFVSVTVEVGAGGPKVLGWRVDRYWVLDDGLGDTRGDGGQIAREDVLLPETESDRIQKVA
jgi:hypothetical protein